MGPILVLAALAGGFPASPLAEVPRLLSYQGRLTSPVGGTVSITFSLYGTVDAATPVWAETHGPVTVDGGVYTVSLGSVGPSPLDPAYFSRPLWLGVRVGDDEEMTPRRPLTSVPYALGAGNAAWDAVGGAPPGISDGIDNDAFGGLDCAAGRSAVWDGNSWVCSLCAAGTTGCLPGDFVACYDGPPGTAGVGECRAGHQFCDQGLFSAACDWQVLPGTEVCDGLDNDCDGTVDEDDILLLNPLQKGVCAGSRQACSPPDGLVADYSGIADYEEEETYCDGLDNDCDGATDEHVLTCPLTLGVCEGTESLCIDGEREICDYGPDYQWRETTLDLLDNDCDGGIDETAVVALDGGGSSSIAVGADGLPIIFHSGGSDEYQRVSLNVAHCGDNSCSSAAIGTISETAEKSSVAIGADGLPIVAYVEWEAISPLLRVTHCNDSACASFTPITIGAAGLWGQLLIRSLSMAIGGDGLPVIAYSSDSDGVTDNSLLVAHCDDNTCSSGTLSTVESSPDDSFGRVAAAVGADGLPVIAYYVRSWEPNLRMLKVARCIDWQCTSATITTVTETGSEIFEMAVGADGLPVIAQHLDPGYLDIIHCNDNACASSTKAVVSDEYVGSAAPISMAIDVDGLPVVCHSGATGLAITRCLDVTCSSSSVFGIDSNYGARGSKSIAIGSDGLPIVSYYAHGHSALMVVKVPTR